MDAHPVQRVGPALGAVISGDQPGRLDDDLHLAAEVGITIVRLDLSWQHAQLRAAAVDGGVVEAVRSACERASSLGMQPWIRLLQPALPKWFENEGGFTDVRTAGRWWPRWVEVAADAVGDVAAGWIPIDAPFELAAATTTDARRHGEVVDSLLVAWRDAWRILRGGPRVATAIDVATVRPLDDSVAAAEWRQRIDQLRWGTWLGALRDGTISIPGRADRELADLAGACDVLGLVLADDVETSLYRAAELGPERPLALTLRLTADTDTDRTTSIESMWRGAERAAAELDLEWVAIDPFVDGPARSGIVTHDRELRDSGQVFVRQS